MPRNRNPTEIILQEYLTNNRGRNLKKIKEGLIYVKSEDVFDKGRIDIIAKKRTGWRFKEIGIELKTSRYDSRRVTDQLRRYLDYMKKRNGSVYFVAPKVYESVFDNLKRFHSNERIEFYEASLAENYEFNFKRVYEDDLGDSRRIKYLDELLQDVAKTYKTNNHKKRRLKRIKRMVNDGFDILEEIRNPQPGLALFKKLGKLYSDLK